MAKEPQTHEPNEGIHGIASAGDEVISDGLAEALGIPARKTPTVIDIDDLPDADDEK